LPVIYSHPAQKDLDLIADWNEQTYGRERAKQYIAFLRQNIDALAINFEKGRQLEFRPSLRYSLIQRRRGGYGHVVVYSIEGKTVIVANIFHSSQNWQAKLANEE
jgi:plasmid stabilization system protein ParE